MLLVEPHADVRASISAAASPFAVVHACPDFDQARARLTTATYDLVVANVRLGDYNGVHLVYLARQSSERTHALVYAHPRDLGIAADVIRAGGFFESIDRMPIVVGAYLVAILPARDRRVPGRPDRRAHARGGRRAWDAHLATGDRG